jgi:hypothetical protein
LTELDSFQTRSYQGLPLRLDSQPGLRAV